MKEKIGDLIFLEEQSIKMDLNLKSVKSWNRKIFPQLKNLDSKENKNISDESMREIKILKYK